MWEGERVLGDGRQAVRGSLRLQRAAAGRTTSRDLADSRGCEDNRAMAAQLKEEVFSLVMGTGRSRREARRRPRDQADVPQSQGPGPAILLSLFWGSGSQWPVPEPCSPAPRAFY